MTSPPSENVTTSNLHALRGTIVVFPFGHARIKADLFTSDEKNRGFHSSVPCVEKSRIAKSSSIITTCQNVLIATSESQRWRQTDQIRPSDGPRPTS